MKKIFLSPFQFRAIPATIVNQEHVHAENAANCVRAGNHVIMMMSVKRTNANEQSLPALAGIPFAPERMIHFKTSYSVLCCTTLF